MTPDTQLQESREDSSDQEREPHLGLKVFDVVVLGAGISGLSVAAEARAQGYSAVILERRDTIAAGTSANSLRIIHGGFRYLQSLHIGRVLKSMRAQRDVWQRFPELLTPLPCVMPLERGMSIRSALPITAAAQFFKALGWLVGWPSSDKLPKVIDSKRISKDAGPLLDLLPGSGGPLLQWWDYQLQDPALLHRRLAQGLDVRLNWNAVAQVEQADATVVVTSSAGQSISGKIVVDCRGSMMGSDHTQQSVSGSGVRSWAKAFNLRLRRPVHPAYGVAFRAGEDRLLFAVPRRMPQQRSSASPEMVVSDGSSGAVGTWYIPGQDPLDPNPTVKAEELLTAFNEVQLAFPSLKLTMDDVIGVEVGILPCESSATEAIALVGSERITRVGRKISVLSTKYTTFLPQAVDVIREVRSCIGLPQKNSVGVC